jgi:dimethylaniline monooxygenase (N-oxide forming)
MSEKKKVAIIGGGLAGITTVKQLRDEGHEVICFEKGANIGGVFAPSGCCDSTMLTSLKFTATRDLYEQMFHPDDDETLAFIGFARPQQGGVPAIAELQARYFAQLCSGTKRLPGRERRLGVTAAEAEYWRREYHITPHVAPLVNHCTYTDAMAERVGCKPVAPSCCATSSSTSKCGSGPSSARSFGCGGRTPTPRRRSRFPLTVKTRRMVALMFYKILTALFARTERFRPRQLELAEESR